MDVERIIGGEETDRTFKEPYMIPPGDAPKVARAEVGPGEGEVERVDEEREEVEEWTGGESDTTDSWYRRLLSWTRSMTRKRS